MTLGDEAFGRELRLEEFMRVGPHDGISALLTRDTKELASTLCHVEDTGRRQPSTNHEEGSHHKLNKLAT